MTKEKLQEIIDNCPKGTATHLKRLLKGGVICANLRAKQTLNNTKGYKQKFIQACEYFLSSIQ